MVYVQASLLGLKIFFDSHADDKLFIGHMWIQNNQ